MERWRSRFAICMALCAMIFACAPSLAWACPLTGQVIENGAPNQRLACAQMQQSARQSARRCSHCPASQSQKVSCCQPLPISSGSANRETLVAQDSAQIPQRVQTRFLHWPAPSVSQAAPREVDFAVRNAVSPPRHWQPPPRATFVSRAPPARMTDAPQRTHKYA